MGYVATLPGHSSLTLARHILAPWYVASGLYAIRQLDGAAGCFVQVKVDDVASPFVRPADGSDADSPTIFPTAFKPLSAEYELGGRWAFMRLGSARSRAPRG